MTDNPLPVHVLSPPPPYPDGWFVLCRSEDLKPSAVLNVPFMGEDVVLYRTKAGIARAIEPFCPHLGAHLGHGGKVEGEEIVCPYHRFAFAPDGRCVRTGFDTAPPDAGLRLLEMREQNGCIFVWWSFSGEPPHWEMPEQDLEGFSPSLTCRFDVSGHVQDAVENFADVTHFKFIHKWDNCVIKDIGFDQHLMKVEISATSWGLPVSLRLACHGLGCILAESELIPFGVTTRFMVAATPMHAGAWTFRVTDALRVNRFMKLPGPLRRMLHAMSIHLAHRWTVSQIKPDVAVWNHRRYLVRPKLTAQDKSIVEFRRWSRQFYRTGSTAFTPTSDPGTAST
ncbi:3-ketosteroid-9-alpha-monooxygenase oxygenase subunit [compost metagenome]|uniref:Rieske 2Fe-2S domain-containing protein n=1 Tax=Achromobacter sp. Root83 TaxID=1736602 RepID=UPI00070E96F4|nr:Rieske 2Fe-2S domain-containing protein [Achromobacter sp. Root83]KRC70396.1 hypothetical protein ASE30_18150 [Achromobacter sp. Root83]